MQAFSSKISVVSNQILHCEFDLKVLCPFRMRCKGSTQMIVICTSSFQILKDIFFVSHRPCQR